ncbi:peroxidasin homolog isoform X2 [Diadema setosum]|uniref:peroxidasin homolog isoform X2 n=1 Tax=Diadema setosum TaxID=31175 RepID=UPI003B3AD7E6
MTAAVYRMAYYSSSMVLTVYLSSALSLLTIIPGCVAPNVIQSPEGQDVLLPCPHQNLDVYLIQWRRVRDGGDLKHLAEINPQGGRSAVSARYNITANLDLAITSIANNDSGTYQCEVSYKGTSSRPRINNTVLNVYEHEVRNVQLGENVILQCSIPKPNVEVKSIYWARQRDQQHLVHWTPQQLDSTYNMAEEYNLALRDFSSLDVGVYWCNVTSSENITYIAHKVIVTTTDVDTLQVQLGKEAVLPCRNPILDFQVASVRWYRQRNRGSVTEPVAHWTSGQCNTTERFNFTSKFGLAIQHFSFVDTGIYWCSISLMTPALVSVSHEFIVAAYEASDKTIKARVGESVRLACPVSRASRTHGEANWTRYSYDMLQATLITTVPRYSVRGDFLTIENASPNDDGVFVCQRPQTERAAGVVHTIDFHTFEVQHGWIDSGWIVSIFLGIICLALVCALVVTNMPKTSSCTAGCCQFVDERPTEDEDNSDGRFPSVSNGTTSGGGHRHPDGQMNGFQMDTIIGRRTQSCQIFTDNGGQTDVSNGTTSGGGHRHPDGQMNGFQMDTIIGRRTQSCQIFTDNGGQTDVSNGTTSGGGHRRPDGQTNGFLMNSTI